MEQEVIKMEDNKLSFGVCFINGLSAVINCDKVVLKQGEISINVHSEAIDSFEYIIVNGIKFKKVVEEEK